MSTEKTFVDFVMDQLSGVSGVSARKMFGEYAIYKGDKVIGLICENQLFIKPTDAGKKHIAKPVMASPYKGAKPFFSIDAEAVQRDWLHVLVDLTADELPSPKPKRPSVKKAKREDK